MATFEEYVKFKNNKPESQMEFRTFEVWHPSNPEPLRFVRDYSQLTATLEVGAPRNAGETVVFQPFSGNIIESAQANDAEQSISVEVVDVAGVMQDYLDKFSTRDDWMTQIEVIYRKYWSGDLSQPAKPAEYLFAGYPSFESSEDMMYSFTATDSDLSQKRGGILYDPKNFPGTN